MSDNKPESTPGAGLEALRERMRTISPAQLEAGLKEREDARKAELAKRLKPFRTPVTESTMRRSSR